MTAPVHPGGERQIQQIRSILANLAKEHPFPAPGPTEDALLAIADVIADGTTPQAPTVDSVPEARADGAGLIAAERQRQIDAEGWAPEYDDTHTIGELVDAAVCYLRHGLDAEMPVVWPWPWTEDWWKPSDDPIKNLVRAGALIAAEIDRLTRAAAGVSSDR